MPVHEIKRVLVQELSSRHITQITGDPGRVRRYKDIRHDTAAAVNGASHHGFVFFAVVQLDAVGRIKFTVHETLVDVLFVFAVFTQFVLFLDTTSRRRVIACDRQADFRTVA